LNIWQLTAKQQEELIKILHILKDIEISQPLEPADNKNINSTIDN